MSGEIIGKTIKTSGKFPPRLFILVKPNTRRTSYLGMDEKGRHCFQIKEKAEENKANLALIKFFKKEFGLRVKIKSGLASREKVIEIQP